MRRTLAFMILAAIVLAGCTSAVGGQGSLEVGAQPPRDTQPSGETTSTPRSTPTTEPPSGDRDSLSCSGERAVAPSGAPYCYVLPRGLEPVEDFEFPGSGEFTTALGFGGFDLIALTVFTTEIDTDSLSDNELRDGTDALVDQELTSEFTFDSSVGRQVTIDGSRAITYSGKSIQDDFDIDVYFLYGGTTEIQINCQSLDHPAEMAAGCRELLDSLQFLPE